MPPSNFVVIKPTKKTELRLQFRRQEIALLNLKDDTIISRNRSRSISILPNHRQTKNTYNCEESVRTSNSNGQVRVIRPHREQKQQRQAGKKMYARCLRRSGESDHKLKDFPLSNSTKDFICTPETEKSLNSNCSRTPLTSHSSTIDAMYSPSLFSHLPEDNSMWGEPSRPILVQSRWLKAVRPTGTDDSRRKIEQKRAELRSIKMGKYKEHIEKMRERLAERKNDEECKDNQRHSFKIEINNDTVGSNFNTVVETQPTYGHNPYIKAIRRSDSYVKDFRLQMSKTPENIHDPSGRISKRVEQRKELIEGVKKNPPPPPPIPEPIPREILLQVNTKYTGIQCKKVNNGRVHPWDSPPDLQHGHRSRSSSKFIMTIPVSPLRNSSDVTLDDAYNSRLSKAANEIVSEFVRGSAEELKEDIAGDVTLNDGTKNPPTKAGVRGRNAVRRGSVSDSGSI